MNACKLLSRENYIGSGTDNSNGFDAMKLESSTLNLEDMTSNYVLENKDTLSMKIA